VKVLALVASLDDTLHIENDAVAPARSKAWPCSTASQLDRYMYKDEISTAATTDIMMPKLNADSFEHYQYVIIQTEELPLEKLEQLQSEIGMAGQITAR
jgi:hypothetical protein